MLRVTLFSLLLSLGTCAPVTEASQGDGLTTKLSDRGIHVVCTAANTSLRLTETEKLQFRNAVQPLETEIAIFVNPTKKFQSFLGIGGAITDASAEVFSKLSAPVQSQFMNAYFGEGGINYNIIRTSIHSCDFGLGSHTCIGGDSALTTFNIEPDRAKRIPMIKRAASMIGDDLVFYASPGAAGL